tara:strand:+ start:615 stop:752 length:138 start_codon:yes stop_codon:yes gene_type:complete
MVEGKYIFTSQKSEYFKKRGGKWVPVRVGFGRRNFANGVSVGRKS